MGAIAEQVRYETFQVEGTENTCSLILWVEEKYFSSSTSITLGTTLASFMSSKDIPKGDAVEKYGTWVYTGQATRQNGCKRFWFAKPFTTLEQTTPILEIPGYRNVGPWPAVLTGLTYVDFEAYDSTGAAYVAESVFKPVIEEGYSGPVRTLLQVYVSQTKYTVTTPTQFRPQPINFFYGVGKLMIPETLHVEVDIEFTTGTPNPRFPYQTFGDTFPATTPTAWPTFIVVNDDQQFVNGLWRREVLIGYKPGT